MILIIGLILAAVFVFTCDKAIKKVPYVFYIISAVISLAIIFLDTKGLPAFVNNYVLSLFTKSAFATSLWIIVMWTGALKNGSYLIKKLMPIRGELSIIAAILTLGHNINYGKTYFVRLFISPESLSANYLIAAVMSLVMMLIMIPLTIISFPQIRKKMNGKLWKKIQRAAYAFYAIIYLHVMTLSVPMAQQGNIMYSINIILYSLIFIGYAVCRIRKWILLKKKPQNKAVLNIASAVAVAVFVVGLSFMGYPFQNADDVLAVNTGNKSVGSNNVSSVTPTQSSSDYQTATQSTANATEQSTSKEKSTEKSTTKNKEKSTEKPTQNKKNQSNSGSNSSSNNNNTVVTQQYNNGTTQENPVQQNENQNNNQNNVQQNNQQGVQQNNNQNNTQQNVQQNNNQNNTQQNNQTAQTPAQSQVVQPNYIYNNGTYTATAFGYDGDVEVTITIENDVITQITGRTFESDSYYFDSAKNSVFSQILNTQQTNVDAHSGATYSSKAIMSAAQTALNSARK